MTVSSARTREWRRLAAGAVALVVADWLLGLTPWLLLAGTCAYLAWHVHHVHLLARWLASGGREPEPGTRGIWAQVFESLTRIRRLNRKRKKRLRKVVMRFQHAAEAMPDGAIILDAAGTILWMNEASGRLLGLERPRDIGLPVSSFIRHPGFADRLNAEEFDEPIRLTSPLREELQLLVRIVPYGGSRRLMLVRDVSRIYNLEQMRKDFVANVSHELRSPLTVIVGYLEALGDDELLPADVRRPVAQMSQQASRPASPSRWRRCSNRSPRTPALSETGRIGSICTRTPISPCSATGTSSTARSPTSRSTRCSTPAPEGSSGCNGRRTETGARS